MDKVSVPEGKSGNWEIKRFEISETQARMSMFSYGSRAPRPGKYTKLTHRGCIVMSDTDAEMMDHMVAVYKAKGNILINGLGIGMVLLNCIKKPEVKKVTVIELSEDVINLVSPHYKERFGDRLTIVHADAMTWKASMGERYGMAWHDIWPDICADNLEQMKTLHRRYGRRCDWQGSWCRRECERLARKAKEEKRLRDLFRPKKFSFESREVETAIS